MSFWWRIGLPCYKDIIGGKATGKATIIPVFFNISEPVVYGSPVVYNSYLFIPFVFGTPLLGLFTYFIFDMGG